MARKVVISEKGESHDATERAAAWCDIAVNGIEIEGKIYYLKPSAASDLIARFERDAIWHNGEMCGLNSARVAIPFEGYMRNAILDNAKTPDQHWLVPEYTDTKDEAYGESRSLRGIANRLAELCGDTAALEREAAEHGLDKKSLYNLKVHGKKPDTANDARSKQKAADAIKSNPFYRMRDPRTGLVDPKVAAHVATLTREIGVSAVTAMAHEAGVTLSGLPYRGPR